MKTYLFDTESCGFYGATILLQYQTHEDTEVILHYVFKEPVKKTIALIEDMANSKVIAYNIGHDSYHITRTYNICTRIAQIYGKDFIPQPYEYYEAETTLKQNELVIFKPKEALDLMIASRRVELFQTAMKQHPLTIREVPERYAKIIVDYLSQEIDNNFNNDLLFGKAPIIHSKGTDRFIVEPSVLYGTKTVLPNMVDITLNFYPSASLKNVYRAISGDTDVDNFDTGITSHFKFTDLAYRPRNGDWLSAIGGHIMNWDTPQKIKYARKDVTMLKYLYNYLGGDIDSVVYEDSMLAVLMGSQHFLGYNIDMAVTEELDSKNTQAKATTDVTININSSQQVKALLLSKCKSITDKFLVINTKKATLKGIAKLDNELGNTAKEILRLRDIEQELRLTQRLKSIGRLYCTFSMSATRTNRAGGGDSETTAKSINPQGIKKGKLRTMFTFADLDLCLSNGDFDGFEVSIFEAVYKDPVLREQLLMDKKIHAMWGEKVFNIPYDTLLTEEYERVYSTCKISFFALLYGAQPDKLGEILGVSTDKVAWAIKEFFSMYKKVEESFALNILNYTIMKDWKLIKPLNYVESFMGYKRYFTFEWTLCRILYDLSEKIPSLLPNGYDDKCLRRKKIVTPIKAITSALLSCIFSIQNKAQRISGNMKIQSAGAEITKRLQYRLASFQPSGLHTPHVETFNVHDEIECIHRDEYTSGITKTVNDFITEYRQKVPLLKMTWKEKVTSWADK